MIARKWKVLLAAMAAAAVIVALLRAMYSYSAQANLQNALSNDVPTARDGEIVPSRPQRLLACSPLVSDCERIIMMIPYEPEIFAARNCRSAGFAATWQDQSDSAPSPYMILSTGLICRPI